MKIIYIFLLLLCIFCSSAQQRHSGIKLLLKDKQTGLPCANDTVSIQFNDSLNTKVALDANGMIFEALVPGSYRIAAGKTTCQTSTFAHIIVEEGKTAYVTMQLNCITQSKKKNGVRLRQVN